VGVQLKPQPQHPNTLSPYPPASPYHPLLTSNPILDKDKQKLLIDSTNLSTSIISQYLGVFINRLLITKERKE
jgi:hypothetical protein